MTLRQQRILVSAGALFVLVAALLPGIVYMGHWGSAGTNHDHAGETHATSHEDHCHVGPARCSGGLSMVGTWWVGEDPVSVEPDTIPTILTSNHDPLPGSAHAARIFQPPRFA